MSCIVDELFVNYYLFVSYYDKIKRKMLMRDQNPPSSGM